MIPSLVIGMKNRGNAWAGALREHPDFSLESIADIDPGVLEERGNALGVPPGRRFTDHRKALESGEIRLAVVVVPNHLHYPVAKAVLEAGVHCLLEKPFAETMEQAEELTALAGRMGLSLVVVQNYRWRLPYAHCAEAVRSGRLGPLLGVEGSFHRDRPPRYEHERRAPYPFLYLQGIHHLDWLLSILPSPVVGVAARHYRAPSSPWENPSVCHILLRCRDGVPVSYRGSYESRGEQSSYSGLWRFEFRDGDIILENDESVWQETRDGRIRLYAPGPEDGNGDLPLLDTVRDSIMEGKEAPTSAGKNLETLGLLFEVIRSGEADDSLPVSPSRNAGGSEA